MSYSGLFNNPPDDSSEIEEAVGIIHDFWLFREGERDYNDYQGLSRYNKAPVLPDNLVHLSDDVFSYLMRYFQWIPTLNPRKSGKSTPHHGLHQHYFTIIAATGGECFCAICLGWAQILAQGPENLILQSGWFDADDGDPPQWKPHYFRISRDKLVSDLQQLAEFGKKAATGEYFIMHLGI